MTEISPRLTLAHQLYDAYSKQYPQAVGHVSDDFYEFYYSPHFVYMADLVTVGGATPEQAVMTIRAVNIAAARSGLAFKLHVPVVVGVVTIAEILAMCGKKRYASVITPALM